MKHAFVEPDYRLRKIRLRSSNITKNINVCVKMNKLYKATLIYVWLI